MRTNFNALGVQQCKVGRYKDAETSFKKALRDDNDNIAYLSNLALSLRKQEKWEEAERALLEAVKIAPKNIALWSDLGLVQAGQHKYEDAIKSCTHAIHLDPTNTLFPQNLAYLKSQQVLEASSHIAMDAAYLNSQLALQASSNIEATNIALSTIVNSKEIVQGVLQKQSSQSSSLKLG